MISREELREKYKNLPRKEKEIIGSSIVKVNLGVALPDDLKRVADFLKGSPYIAKSGALDEVIQILHDDKVKIKEMDPHTESLSDDELKRLKEGLEAYDEDQVTTTKSGPVDLKHD